MNVEVEADTDDIDTSDADEDVVFLDEPVVYEPEDEDLEADLFASKTSTTSASTSLTAEVSAWVKAKYPSQHGTANGKAEIKIRDTVSVSAKVSVSINYKTTLKVPTKLTSVVATSTITAKNVFNINASAGLEWKMNDKKLGTIPLGTVSGVTFSVPVYLVFRVNFDGEFDYTATNTVTQSTTVTYKSGSVSSKTTKETSSSKELKTEAKITLTLGIKASLEVSFLKVITANLTAEAGIIVTGRLQSLNSTSTYRHNAKVCLTAELELYVTPSFTLKLVKKKVADKTWSTSKKRIMTFYVHETLTGSWSYGSGECPYREYLITLQVKDNAGKAMSGVEIKEGDKSLGTTDSKGQKQVWLSMATHTLKFSKQYYTTGTLKFTVTKAETKNISLYKGVANESYFTIGELMEFTDEDWAYFLEEPEDVANTIFRIQSSEDLVLLSQFAARADRDTAGIRFVLNGATGAIDLTGLAWTPIGSAEKPFRGELDGNGFTITGLQVSTGDYAGLFGNMEGALVHDLTLSGAAVVGGSYTGALAGRAAAGSNLYDISVSGTVSGGNNTGGIIGELSGSSLVNSCNTASVSGGSNVGGLVGSLVCSDTAGRITNCYSAGELSGSGVGGVCGTVSYSAGASLAEDEDVVYETGIHYAYYLDSTAAKAVASAADGVEVVAFPVTLEQLNGTATEGVIKDDSDFASTQTLLEALNNWYWKNGSINATDEDEEIPEGSPNDYYNKWYPDTMTEEGEGGYPVFGEKPVTYALTVHYVYEDDSEAKPSVTLYLTEGQEYDVDSYKIPGYHTYELEYKGQMPPYDLEYRVIYIANSPYPTMTELSTSETDAAEGQTYGISTEGELILFAEYVNRGRNTAGVNFVQLESITMSNDTAFASAGSQDAPFQGSFYGDYLGIENLPCSLFGFASGASISAVVANLTAAVTDGGAIGGIAAATDNSVISSCIVTANITGNASGAGAVVGSAFATTIDKCEVSGSIAGESNIGGVAGNLIGSTVKNCASTVAVSGTSNIGGIAGASRNYAAILNSYSNAAVSGTSNAGGILGAGQHLLELRNVYHAGAVSGDGVVGSASGAIVEAESVWYPAGGTTSVTGAASYAADAAGVAALLDSLNQWVAAQNSADYLTWSATVADETEAGLTDDAAETPVFGMAYTNWLLDFMIEAGKMAYTYVEGFYPGGAVYIAIYDKDDQMIEIRMISESGKDISVPNGAAYAKAFILAEDGEPFGAAITANAG